ncbi:hypothetical protein AKJ47_02715 [candidate division MSBL1 archaeon SCGC-AAA261G05]|uniref:Uncharacterized protein n=2 Tax=candidate division MSBL1 TaxID=215777 RepID=A0A133V9Q6_9EURY|nr:hypothetical protein AKJ47_02715 [candidate division MSBL1 archaeon SCGC-AAA261G05]KXB04305.1 hypothetical protein AKJ48_03040 [candidate division MSBL1 archaeon SCGC-AAA261O19]
MKIFIVVYKQPDRSKSVQLSRALHGYTDSSNYGKYSYEREGLLEKITYLKLMNGVFILKERDSDRLIKLLEKYQAEYYAGPVTKTSGKGEVLLKDEE